MLRMLFFLRCAQVDQIRAQAALEDLQVLVHYDQGVLVLSTCIPDRHLLGDPRDLSTDDREPSGCSVLLRKFTYTIPMEQHTHCLREENTKSTYYRYG